MVVGFFFLICIGRIKEVGRRNLRESACYLVFVIYRIVGVAGVILKELVILGYRGWLYFNCDKV